MTLTKKRDNLFLYYWTIRSLYLHSFFFRFLKHTYVRVSVTVKRFFFLVIRFIPNKYMQPLKASIDFFFSLIHRLSYAYTLDQL